MGDVLNLGKLHVLLKGAQLGADSARQENRLYQLFGDPTMEIRRSAPAFVASATASLVGADVHVAVGGNGGEGALATLLQDGEPIAKAVLGADGVATLRPEAPIADGSRLDVVIDRAGFEKKTIALRAAVPRKLPDLQYGRLQLYSTSSFWALAIKNAGDADAGPFSVRVSAESAEFPGVPTLESRTFSFPQGVPAGQAVGTNYGLMPVQRAICPIKVEIDPDRAVQESDRTNNTVDVNDETLCTPPSP
jgi:hypothetical protein